MHRPPSSAIVAGLLLCGSAVYALATGTLGLELHAFHASRTVVVISALVHVYAGLGLWAGDALARRVAIWILGLGWIGAFVAMYRAANAGGGFPDYAAGVVTILVTWFFLWHLSGPASLEHVGEGAHVEGHQGHAHH